MDVLFPKEMVEVVEVMEAMDVTQVVGVAVTMAKSLSVDSVGGPAAPPHLTI